MGILAEQNGEHFDEWHGKRADFSKVLVPQL